MSKILEIKNLSKKLSGNLILNKLNLSLDRGKILAILGPNGAGKTTLLKMIAGLSKPSGGEILIDGLNPNIKTKEFVSFLSDKEILPDHMKIKNAIKLYETFFADFVTKKAYKLLEQLELNENQEIRTLSKGIKEKFYLILCLSRNAKLYILDEPIAGVDVITREDILKIIVENIYEDASVIVTTHLIDDIEHIFDEFVFMQNGAVSEIYNAEKIRNEENITITEFYKKIYRNGGNLNV